jgi:HEAT repeat protein
LAFIGLKAVDRTLERKEVLECFRESIQESAEDPEFLARTINYLRFQEFRQNGEPPFTSLRFVPEIEAALFHPDEKVRRAARIALTGIQPSDARGLVERLSKLLDDESRKDRTEVIRALAAIGPQSLPVEEKLTKMAHSKSDPNRYPAAVALEQIRGNRDESYQNLELDPGATDFSPYQRRLDAERKELFPNGIYPPRDPILGGGGGFF